MPVCEICEKESDEVFECRECGARFCRDCGDPDRELCVDCTSYEEAYRGEGFEFEEEGEEY